MTQEFVTLPREVVEQALEAMEDAGMQRGSTGAEFNAIKSLRAALEQPQNHVSDAGNMVPAGWKLVPVEPTDEMVEAGDHEIEKWGVDASSSGAFRAMLAAAPQPPTDQQPYLWYDAERDRLWNQEDAKYMDMSGTIPLYTHPQPKREPLTDEQVMQAVRHLYQSDFAAGMGFPDDLDVARAIEAAHNIKEKQ